MGLARLEFRVEDPDALEQLRHKSLPAYEIQPGEGLATHFVNAFVRTLDECSVCERKKYPKHYDIPEPSDVILDDAIVRKISPTVR